jgi:LAO/AO transport system kinase
MALRRPSPQQLIDGVLTGDRALLARAITLVESTLPVHQAQASEILTALMPHTGGAHRVGITGVPGVGKSTFVEALGLRLVNQGHKVAVLAVDPSSSRTGGSILGDKTRMEFLSREKNAFIRPSPSSGTLGGVASRTREALLLCEAAGFDVVLVETVGVGQSELAVAQMTDVFLVLMLAGAGDELQGIKRGLMELADAMAVNKADGDNLRPAERAAQTYRSALRALHPGKDGFKPQVRTCSALQDIGIQEVWELLLEHKQHQQTTGAWASRRQGQQQQWMWQMVDEGLRAALRADPELHRALPELQARVLGGTLAPTRAAEEILKRFLRESS